LYLIRILIISLLIRIKNGKVYYLGVGYGPLKRRSAKRYSRWSLYLANKVIVRDPDSIEELNKILPKAQSSVLKAGDLSVLYPSFENISKVEKDDILGISLTSFGYSSGNISDNVWHEYFLPRIVKMYKETNVKVKVFVFRGGAKESDIQLSTRIQTSLLEIDESRIELIPFSYDVDLFLEHLTSCKWFIATRYHSAVLAYLAGSKLLVVPYHNKLVSFAKEIDLTDESIVDLKSLHLSESFFNNFNEAKCPPSHYIENHKHVLSEVISKL
jgi:polysaccharide pyruvyl transferase WcaK-like protein